MAQPTNVVIHRADVAKILYELRRCPTWILLRPDEIELRAGTTRIYYEIAKFDNATIREALIYFCSSGEKDLDSTRDQAKIFALLRVVFDVPAGFLSSLPHWGSWGSPVVEGRVNLLWPFRHGDGGRLILEGMPVSYFGPPYDALAEFDYFATRFMRQK